MMHKNSRYFILLLILSISVSGGPRRPKWVDTLPEKPLLYQGFGVAVSSGTEEEDRARADQNAKVEIIQEISSSISSSVQDYYSESISNRNIDATESMESFSTLSSAFASATVDGIKITDRYYDKKKKVYYSRATLSRSAYSKQLKQKTSGAKHYAQERYSIAMKSIADGNIRLGLDHLSEALGHVLITQSIVKKHIRGELDNQGEQVFLDIRLGHELSNLMSNIQFVKRSGDGQKGERSQALSQPFEGQLFYNSDGKKLPLGNTALSVSLEGAKADFSPIIYTNHEGSFEAKIDRIISADSPSPQLSIHLYLPQLSLLGGDEPMAQNTINQTGLSFSFSVDVAASIKIFVRILEEVNGEQLPKSKSEATLIKALISQKYKVINAMHLSNTLSLMDLDFAILYEDYQAVPKPLNSHAEYAIFGLLSSETSSTGTLNYARASAKINFVDLYTGRILASGSQDNVKAAGNTEAKANVSALRKCSSAAIAEIMQGLDQALE